MGYPPGPQGKLLGLRKGALMQKESGCNRGVGADNEASEKGGRRKEIYIHPTCVSLPTFQPLTTIVVG